MSTTAVTIVAEFERRFLTGDLAGVAELLADDIVVHESDSVPYPGDHVGHEAFFKLGQAFVDTWEFEGEPNLQFLDAGQEHAVVLVRAPVKAKATGQALELRICEVHTVRDGKITETTMYYFDTKQVADATASAG